MDVSAEHTRQASHTFVDTIPGTDEPRRATRFLDWRNWPDLKPTRELFLLTVGIALLIGFLDYVSGDEISLAAVYILPIAMGCWYFGRASALALSALSVVVWMIGDVANGFAISSWLVPVWNCTIRLVFYYVVIHLIHHIRVLNVTLEQRVLARTDDLRKEILERKRLEQELLQVSERERRQLGCDLHDGLCQHLTGTALVVQALRERLAKRGFKEAGELERVVDLIEEGITLSRSVAKGLQPVEEHRGGLMQALQETAALTNEMFEVSCRFECEAPVIISNASVANHLYHIAREAVANAVKHARPRNILIALDSNDDSTVLVVTDDGVGIPSPLPRGEGMGLRNMAQRAKLIGAILDIQNQSPSGTAVRCSLAASLA